MKFNFTVNDSRNYVKPAFKYIPVITVLLFFREKLNPGSHYSIFFVFIITLLQQKSDTSTFHYHYLWKAVL